MAASFYFYDLETSGFDARGDRIMQFAGIRTDSQLQPIGEPHNIMIKMTPDVVPSPDAILVTGITPQATIADGVTEADFLKIFFEEIVTPDTCFLGYNTVRFDDEFMRHVLYRNFYDPYEWQWANGCSRWDLLDVVRMTRALRPDGIKWPFNEAGRATNRLELITKLNGIDHYAAHDALSDVHATIAVAQLIRQKQRKLFDYLFECRGKKKVEELAGAGQPFVYSSGKYSADFEKTAVVATLAHQVQNRGVYVYDLRFDPAEYAAMTPQQLADRWRYVPRLPDGSRDESVPPRLPVKLMQFNHCPAVAPLGVLDEPSQQRLHIDLKAVQHNLTLLHGYKDFPKKLLAAVEILDAEREQSLAVRGPKDVEWQLYDGFFESGDKQTMRAIRAADPAGLGDFKNRLSDHRLQELLSRYKARNYPQSLSADERHEWDEYLRHYLMDGGQSGRLARFFQRLQELAAESRPDGSNADKSFLLEELQLYGQSIVPVVADEDEQ